MGYCADFVVWGEKAKHFQQTEAYKPCLGFRCDCCGSAVTWRQIPMQELPSQVKGMAPGSVGHLDFKDEVV